MVKKLYPILAVIVLAAMILAACAPAATEAPTEEAPPPEVEPTEAPPPEEPFKVGFVTDTGGIDDQSFNTTQWAGIERAMDCLLYTSPSPRDQRGSRMPSSA